MASIITHAICAATITKVLGTSIASTRLLLLCAVLGMLPDADVLTFKFGVSYHDCLGHRGFFHSIVWSAITAIIATVVYLKFIDKQPRPRITLASIMALCFVASLSHPLLDACTTGGLGIAFFAPFDCTRYFFPWRVIAVSPIGIRQFFGEWGLRVIMSEIVYVWIPCAVALVIATIYRRVRSAVAPNT